MKNLWENWTLVYFMNIHLKWRTTCQIAPSVNLLKLSQTQARTASKWSRNTSNLLLDFSLYATAAVSIVVSASLDRMRTLLTALTARQDSSRPMESHASILTIFLSHLGYRLCWQILYMQRRCVIEQIMYISLELSRMSLMAPIISLYSTPLFLVMRTSPSSTFLINVTLPLVFQRMVLLHLRGVMRHVSLSYFSTTISLLKDEILLLQSQGPRSLGIGTHFAGHSFKNWFN